MGIGTNYTRFMVQLTVVFEIIAIGLIAIRLIAIEFTPIEHWEEETATARSDDSAVRRRGSIRRRGRVRPVRSERAVRGSVQSTELGETAGARVVGTVPCNNELVKLCLRGQRPTYSER